MTTDAKNVANFAKMEHAPFLQILLYFFASIDGHKVFKRLKILEQILTRQKAIISYITFHNNHSLEVLMVRNENA